MSAPDSSQETAVRWLSDPATYGLVEPVELIETHGAYVFLAGPQAFKIKRAVHYDYLDQSTLAKRRVLLEREFALNVALAPELYDAVVPLDAEGHIGGAGEPIEWVLRMRRFPADAELSNIAERSGIDDRLAEEVGRSVARFHLDCPIDATDGAVLIREIVEELGRVFAGLQTILGSDADNYRGAAHQRVDATAALLNRRSASGFVRRAHGDLHLRNFVVLDGHPKPIDALEFDERLGTCDVLYDLAFLLMDMRHGGHDRAANLAMNAWLAEFAPPQEAGLATLPLFLSIRAAIRAMVEAQAADVAGNAAEHVANAQRYLADAADYLEPGEPRLVALGGFSGSGKSTLARAIAHRLGPPPGAVILRSDVIRKSLAGKSTLERLPSDAYTREAAESVYREMRTRARKALAAGRAVLLDAVHDCPASRQAVARLAEESGVSLQAAWIDAPEDVLRERVAGRIDDASDATVEVVRQQLASGVEVTWPRVMNDGSLTDGADRLTCLLGLRQID